MTEKIKWTTDDIYAVVCYVSFLALMVVFFSVAIHAKLKEPQAKASGQGECTQVVKVEGQV